MRYIITIALMLMIFACRGGTPTVQNAYSLDQFLSREGRVGEHTFRYRVYVPPDRKAGEHLPVMLYLHGAGNRGSDNESQLNGLANIILENKEKISFIVIIPQCPDDRFWDAQIIGRANQALEDTVAEFEADTSRLYLAGFSLGGYGVWSMAATYPNKFAALVPMSGRVIPRPAEMNKVSPEIAEFSKARDPYKAFAERIDITPVWIFHGAEDTVVAVDNSRRMAEALKSAGNAGARYSEVKGASHEPLGFQTSELFIWLGQQRLSEK